MKKIDICYASSDEFTIHTGISLLSLLDNNRGGIGRAFFLDYGMTEASQGKLRAICEEYGVECVFIWAKDKLIEIGEQTGIKNFRDSFATYSRAFIDLLMPEDVDTFLYVDSDTAVGGSLAPLAEIDMTDKVICGCAGAAFYGHRKDKKDRHPELDRLLTKNSFYIQCGVLWYSLNNWRRFHCRELIMEATKHIEQYPFADQTLINNALPDRYFGQMPLKYNLTRHNGCDKIALTAYQCGGFYEKEEILEATHHPVLVHYCGGPMQRPWYEGCLSRQKGLYLRYKERSVWRDVPLLEMKKPKTFKEKMGHRLMVFSANTDHYVLHRIASKVRRMFFA